VGIFGKLFGDKPAEQPKPLEPVDLAAITEELIAEARAQGVEGKLRVEGNILFIDDGDGAERHIFLGNIGKEYAAAEAVDRPRLIAKYARLAVRPMRVAKPDLRARVLPKLQPRRERELIKLRLPDGANVEGLLEGRPIAGGELLFDLAVDEPEMIRVLTTTDLVGITEQEAHACALDNLRTRSKQPWKPLAPGVWGSPWGDQWDGARLALPELFRDLAVEGKPIVVVPNRNTVLVAGSRDVHALRLLYLLTRKLVEQDRPVYPAPLVLDGGEWRCLDVQRDVAAVQLVPELLFLSSLSSSIDHAVCGELAGARLIARGFTRVAGVQLVDDEGLPVMMLADLDAGERVAVPQADMIRFGNTLVVWYKAVPLFDLAPIEDIWPPHFEVRRTPTSAELDAARVRPKT